jgi:hypothetical protein
MQTNPNWLAFFIITDPSPFDDRLLEILHGYNDSRLIFVDVDMKYRPVVSIVFRFPTFSMVHLIDIYGCLCLNDLVYHCRCRLYYYRSCNGPIIAAH